LLVPVLFTVAAFAAFVGLGTWQLQRKTWKETLIATLDRRLAAPPVDLPLAGQWGALDPVQDEFRRVKFTASFVPGAEALVYASGSALRSDVSGLGYWVLAPARLASGGLVVVNRGFIPEALRDAARRPGTSLAGESELVGVMRWPEARGIFSPKDDPARNLWFVRDPGAIASAKGWGDVAPFLVELESPPPPGGVPKPGALRANLRNEHLQYAITWYALALVVVVMFALWVRSRPENAGS
jgi:surfeit locus 1 family protein